MRAGNDILLRNISYMKPLGVGSFLIGGAVVVIGASIWGFWTLYQAGPPVTNKPAKNVHTSTNTSFVPAPVNTNRNTNTNPPAHQITNISVPTNSQANTYDGWVDVVVSNVNITTSGTTGTASWTTNVPTGGIFYYGIESHTEHLVYVDGNYDKTNISVTFPVTPGTTYVYSIDPCYETPAGGVTCVPQPISTFTAGQPTSPPAQAGGAVISNIVTSYTLGIILVSWQTSLSANATVDWGQTASYGQTRTVYTYSTSHNENIPILAGQTIHFRLRSCTPMEDYHCTESDDLTFTAP